MAVAHTKDGPLTIVGAPRYNHRGVAFAYSSSSSLDISKSQKVDPYPWQVCQNTNVHQTYCYSNKSNKNYSLIRSPVLKFYSTKISAILVYYELLFILLSLLPCYVSQSVSDWGVFWGGDSDHGSESQASVFPSDSHRSSFSHGGGSGWQGVCLHSHRIRKSPPPSLIRSSNGGCIQSHCCVMCQRVECKFDAPDVLRGDAGERGRFGSSIAPLPDLNADGFNDLAVGAPLENQGQGSVYIFHGDARRTINTRVSQVGTQT